MSDDRGGKGSGGTAACVTDMKVAYNDTALEKERILKDTGRRCARYSVSCSYKNTFTVAADTKFPLYFFADLYLLSCAIAYGDI